MYLTSYFLCLLSPINRHRGFTHSIDFGLGSMLKYFQKAVHLGVIPLAVPLVANWAARWPSRCDSALRLPLVLSRVGSPVLDRILSLRGCSKCQGRGFSCSGISAHKKKSHLHTTALATKSRLLYGARWDFASTSPPGCNSPWRVKTSHYLSAGLRLPLDSRWLLWPWR